MKQAMCSTMQISAVEVLCDLVVLQKALRSLVTG